MFARRCTVALAFALAVSAFGASEVAAQSGSVSRYFAIENATVVTVSGRTWTGGTIVIENGLITAVGNVPAPAGAWVIDGTGLTVYPGLIDGLGSAGLPTPPTTDRAGARRPGGGGGSREPNAGAGSDEGYSRGPEDRPATFTWVNAADQLVADDEALGKWRSAGFTSAVTAPRSGFFPGHAAIVNLAGDRGAAMVVMSPVALRFNLRGGPGHQGYPTSLMGSFAYIKQVFSDARQYRVARTLYDDDPSGLERPPYDRALEPLGAVLAGQERLLFPANSRTEILRALATSEEIGVRPIVYGAHAGYAAVDALRGRDVPVLVNLDWPAAPRDGDPEADTSLDDLRFRLLAPTTPARFDEAGIPFALSAEGLRSPRDVHDAVRKAIEAGLSPDAAVRAFTLSPAEIFGAADRLGSLEVGKIANLLVTEGDLFAEGTEIRMVFVDGRKYEAGRGRGGQGGGGPGGARWQGWAARGRARRGL